MSLLKLSLMFIFALNVCRASEPILFVPIIKSASVYIGNKLANGLNRSVMGLTNENEFPMYYINPRKFEDFLKIESLAREHLYPTPENIALIKESGLKMIFHVRDLRQVIVSFANHHYRDISNGSEFLVEYYKNLGLHVELWTLRDFIEHSIQLTNELVDILQGWLKVHKEGTISILITSFEEFCENESLFFEKILDFYNIPKSDFGHCHIPKNKEFNFRKGLKEEWREVLSQEQKDRINAIIPEELFTFFGWER